MADYVRQDKLTVAAIAIYDANSEKAEIKQFGNRLGMEDFRKFFEADKNGAKVAELKEMFKSLVEKYSGISSASSKSDMISALQ